MSHASQIKEITKEEILKKYDKTSKVIPKNVVKYFDSSIMKLDNLYIVDLDHNELELLQLKGLLDENLIKPVYLS